MKKLTNTLAALILIISYSCSSTKVKTSDNEGSEKTAVAISADEWIWLFDGTSTDGWREFNSDSLPENWVIEEETLKSLGSGDDIGGDIVYGPGSLRISSCL